MREDENPLSPNTIGNTIIYYKTVILLDQQVATLGPKFIYLHFFNRFISFYNAHNILKTIIYFLRIKDIFKLPT